MKRLSAAGRSFFPQPLYIGFLFVALLLLPGSLTAQSLEAALARSGYSDSQKASIEVFFAQIEGNGIPVELLLPKLEEGIAKRISGPRVLKALNREAESLKRARALIISVEGARPLLSDQASWARTANLIAGGIPDGEIKELIRICTSCAEAFRPATYLYVALTDWGLATDPALQLIGALLDSSILPENYMGIIDLLAGGRRRRIAPEEVVRRILQHLDRSKTIKELEKWIF